MIDDHHKKNEPPFSMTHLLFRFTEIILPQKNVFVYTNELERTLLSAFLVMVNVKKWAVNFRGSIYTVKGESIRTENPHFQCNIYLIFFCLFCIFVDLIGKDNKFFIYFFLILLLLINIHSHEKVNFSFCTYHCQWIHCCCTVHESDIQLT